MAKKVLSVSEVLAEQKTWDERYLGSVIHSIEVSDNDADEKYALIERFLSRENRAEFSAANPYSKSVFLPQLIERVLDLQEKHERRSRRRADLDGPQGPDKVVYAMVTFTDRRWATNNKAMAFDLKAAKMKVRNALSGTEFLARFEAAHYVNEDFEHRGRFGKLVLFHCHALVWASSFSKLKRVREGVAHRFHAPEGTGSSMRLDNVPKDEVPKVVGYISKMPAVGYMTLKHEGAQRQVKAALRPNAHYRFFKAMTEYSMFDFWLGSGEGAKALRKARAAAVDICSKGPRVTQVPGSRPSVRLRDRSARPRARPG